MKHFIGTRFNLKAPDWKTTKSGNFVLTNEWLAHRFHIFENYCLPSVKNQSNLNFKWCIFFDSDTPEKYKQKIFSISLEFPVIYPIFIESMGKLNDTFKDFIINNIANADSHIITTRIDNDDIIHQDFVAIIQSLFQPKDLCVIDIQKGYQVTIDTQYPEIRLYTHPFNAFISVVENTKAFDTVFSRMHYGWKNELNIIGYKKKRLWIELVHKENKVNHSLTYLKKAWVFNKSDFGLSDKFIFKLNILQVSKTNLKIDIERFLKLIKNTIKFLIKLPKRARRFLLKKIA